MNDGNRGEADSLVKQFAEQVKTVNEQNEKLRHQIEESNKSHAEETRLLRQKLEELQQQQRTK